MFAPAPVYTQSQMIYGQAYGSPGYVQLVDTPQYPVPYVQSEQGNSWSDTAMLAVAGAVVGGAIGYAAKGRTGDVKMTHTDHEPTSALDQYNSRRQFLRASAAAAMATTFAAASPTYAAGPKNSVNFSNVKDGATVPSKFTYKFEVTGYGLSPAADGLKEGSGHHHLVIDGPTAFVEKGEAIPFDATHKHYGKAQTEGELELEPGKHKLTLQFANANHESYGKEFAKTITVTVKDA
jgi:hypothetical protein